MLVCVSPNQVGFRPISTAHHRVEAHAELAVEGVSLVDVDCVGRRFALKDEVRQVVREVADLFDHVRDFYVEKRNETSFVFALVKFFYFFLYC